MSHLRLDDFGYLSEGNVVPIGCHCGSDGSIPIEMIAVIATLVTVSEVFCRIIQRDDWEQELDSANTCGILHELADCRNLVWSPGLDDRKSALRPRACRVVRRILHFRRGERTQPRSTCVQQPGRHE